MFQNAVNSILTGENQIVVNGFQLKIFRGNGNEIGFSYIKISF